jgi:hypothetical protein
MTDHNKIAVLATTPPDWQVLLSGYAPLVLYAVVCIAEWVHRGPAID